ncbi:MAG: hypothetical protein XD95_0497, partial [Microgenomates bacterium 39_7]
MSYRIDETRFATYYSSTIRGSLLGKWSQRVDPTLPYYQPEFTVFKQPVLSLSFSSDNPRDSSSKSFNLFSHLWESVWESGVKTTSLMTKILLNWILLMLLLGSLAIATIYLGPKLYYSHLSPSMAVNDANQNEHLSLLGQLAQQQPLDTEDLLNSLEKRQVEEERYLPAVDETLPPEDWIIIPKIGVHTQLQQTETEAEALDTGVWWVPDFGVPGDLLKPMIVVGHRYGWEWWWKSNYWQLHSFYKLPLLEIGDRVEIISEQRKFIYEIYSGEEGEQISDYDADLILYTCKHLNSPVRYFRYARIV